MYYLNMEEQRIEKAREEDEARKREGKCSLISLTSFCFVFVENWTNHFVL